MARAPARRVGESLFIGDNIRVTVLACVSRAPLSAAGGRLRSRPLH